MKKPLKLTLAVLAIVLAVDLWAVCAARPVGVAIVNAMGYNADMAAAMKAVAHERTAGLPLREVPAATARAYDDMFTRVGLLPLAALLALTSCTWLAVKVRPFSLNRRTRKVNP